MAPHHVATVACNMYISTACQQLLTPLVKLAQSDRGALLVHTFVDPIYQRSSFHWTASSAASIVPVATRVAQAALQFNHQREVLSSEPNAHPHVGMVDHIAVMPVVVGTTKNNRQAEAAAAAHAIGKSLDDDHDKTDILYYGAAHEKGYSLAYMRRTYTHFFQTTTPSSPQQQRILIGTPPHFVENYNIRLSAPSANIARALTRCVRKDGAVEALTLPYYGKSNTWEVACNLLVARQQAHVDTAVDEFLHKSKTTEDNEITIHCRYRVGTTVEQCQQAWVSATGGGGEAWNRYQHKVRDEFVTYF